MNCVLSVINSPEFRSETKDQQIQWVKKEVEDIERLIQADLDMVYDMKKKIFKDDGEIVKIEIDNVFAMNPSSTKTVQELQESHEKGQEIFDLVDQIKRDLSIQDQ